jgi:hypothetical protein
MAGLGGQRLDQYIPDYSGRGPHPAGAAAHRAEPVLNESNYFGEDVDDAYAFVLDHFRGLANDLDSETKTAALAALRANLAAHQTLEGVLYDSAMWLIEARLAG